VRGHPGGVWIARVIHKRRVIRDFELRRDKDEGVDDDPVPIHIRRDVGALLGVHPQIEDFRHPQFDERFGPNPRRSLRARFGKDNLEVVIAQGIQAASSPK
jgi:hypothetical protein